MFKKTFSVLLTLCLLATGLFSSCKKETEVVPEAPAPKLEIATTTSDLKNAWIYNEDTKDYTVCDTDEKIIRYLHKAGFKYIDFSMYSFTPDCVYMQENWRDEVLALKAVADELGMQFVQAHSQGGNPLSIVEDSVEFLVSATIRSIEICEVLGIKNTVVHAGTREGLSKEEWFDANKAFYERLLPTAERCGVNVLCENSTRMNTGMNYYANSGEDMLEFINYVNHPNFHGCWDTGHANCEGDQYDDIVTLGDEIYAIHYHDNFGRDTHDMPFCGTLDNDRVMTALKKINFHGYFTLEVDGQNRTKHTWNGPNLPIIKELGDIKTFERIDQEVLLYQVAEYLLDKHGMLKK